MKGTRDGYQEPLDPRPEEDPPLENDDDDLELDRVRLGMTRV